METSEGYGYIDNSYKQRKKSGTKATMMKILKSFGT